MSGLGPLPSHNPEVSFGNEGQIYKIKNYKKSIKVYHLADKKTSRKRVIV